MQILLKMENTLDIHSDPSRSILSEIVNIPIDEQIKQRADALSQRLGSCRRRGKLRKLFVFFCLYSASKELRSLYPSNKEYHLDPYCLGGLMGMDKSDVNRAVSHFSPSRTHYQAPLVMTSPLDLVPGYCNLIGLTHKIQENVLSLAKQILDANPDLNNPYPQKVAAGIIAYYLEIHGYKMRTSALAELFHLSEPTIQDSISTIAKTHNMI